MTDTILGIRQTVVTRRLSGGSNNIKWSPPAEAFIRQHVDALPEKVLLGIAEMKLFDSQSPAAAPVMEAHVLRAMNSSALSWQVQISNGSTDLMLDQIAPNGWNLRNVGSNLPVLLAHDSSALPVGQSSMPWLRGGTALMANVAFPEPGTSAVSDQVRAMVAAGVLRGASVGFIPGQFKFSKDPARPLGIDFLSGHILTEWSLCSVPCNQSCLVVGPTSGGQSASDMKTADLRREARMLAAKARSIIASIPDAAPLTREQRIAEAQALRRLAARS
jgi:phage head maturation protease